MGARDWIEKNTPTWEGVKRNAGHAVDEISSTANQLSNYGGKQSKQMLQGMNELGQGIRQADKAKIYDGLIRVMDTTGKTAGDTAGVLPSLVTPLKVGIPLVGIESPELGRTLTFELGKKLSKHITGVPYEENGSIAEQLKYASDSSLGGRIANSKTGETLSKNKTWQNAIQETLQRLDFKNNTNVEPEKFRAALLEVVNQYEKENIILVMERDGGKYIVKYDELKSQLTTDKIQHELDTLRREITSSADIEAFTEAGAPTPSSNPSPSTTPARKHSWFKDNLSTIGGVGLGAAILVGLSLSLPAAIALGTASAFCLYQGNKQTEQATNSTATADSGSSVSAVIPEAIKSVNNELGQFTVKGIPQKPMRTAHNCVQGV